MKATGVIRSVDELGRLVIPKEIRKTMDIRCGDPLEIFVDGSDTIMLKKYLCACVFCQSTEELDKLAEVVTKLSVPSWQAVTQ